VTVGSLGSLETDAGFSIVSPDEGLADVGLPLGDPGGTVGPGVGATLGSLGCLVTDAGFSIVSPNEGLADVGLALGDPCGTVGPGVTGADLVGLALGPID